MPGAGHGRFGSAFCFHQIHAGKLTETGKVNDPDALLATGQTKRAFSQTDISHIWQ